MLLFFSYFSIYSIVSGEHESISFHKKDFFFVFVQSTRFLFAECDKRTFFSISLIPTQGLCVATLFCFCNGEVMAQVKRRWRIHFFRPRANSYTATQVSVRSRCSLFIVSWRRKGSKVVEFSFFWYLQLLFLITLFRPPLNVLFLLLALELF